MPDAPRRFRFPTPFTVLLAVTALAAAATWLVPAGRYATLRYDEAARAFVVDSLGTERSRPPTQATLDALGVRIGLGEFVGEDSAAGAITRPVSIPGTYARVEGDPQGVIDVLQAPVLGIHDSIDVILFVLVLGGFIGVFNRSGAFDIGLRALVQRFRGREPWLIAVAMLAVALGGTTFGMAEETFAFYPLLVPVFVAAGFDVMVPLAVIFVGSSIGTMASTTNPFATIIASNAAGVAWTTGLGGRVLMFALALAFGIGYVVRYGARVRADPSRSLVRGFVPPTVPALEASDALATGPAGSGTAAGVRPVSEGMARWLLVLFAAVFVVMIAGVSRFGWWFPEMTTLFFAAAIVVGVLQGAGERATVAAFIDGARDLLGVAFVIGLARGVTLVLDRGGVSGTLLFRATGALDGVPGVAFLLALLLVFVGLALFIQSSSGLAVLTMPIVGGLADVAGVPREAVVNAYLYGLGITALLTPAGLVLPSLAMVDVDYGAWLRFALPLVGGLALLAVASLVASAVL